MATQPRPRKGVCAIVHDPDGSAFQRCGTCGVSVAIALADIQECESKMDKKNNSGKVVGVNRVQGRPQTNQQRFRDQPVSAYRLFMESFMKSSKPENFIEMDRKGHEKWLNMSKEEKDPYVARAKMLDFFHQEALNKEEDEIVKVDDEADSSMAATFDKYEVVYTSSESGSCSGSNSGFT